MTVQGNGHHPLPVLTEDESRFDWSHAQYRPEVKVEPTRATIRHDLQFAETLERLVAERRATWAAELRCPKTLLSRVEEATEHEQVVSWTPEEVDESMYVIPGLLAATDFELEPQPDELTPLWRGLRLEVGRGWWLARGVARRTKTLGQSLLTFHLAPKLPSGRMHIRPSEADQDLRFNVHLAEDVWGERLHRHVQMAALIGAFGRMRDIGAGSESPDDEPHVMAQIRRRLEEEDVPTWTDLHYDPARAATAIEPFLALAAEARGGEDE